MRRFQRRAHLWIWMILAPLVAIGLALALRSGPTTPTNNLDRAIAAVEP